MQTITIQTTSHDLENAGFSPTEIARLQELQRNYHPLREYLEQNQQFERLQFLKWSIGRDRQSAQH